MPERKLSGNLLFKNGFVIRNYESMGAKAFTRKGNKRPSRGSVSIYGSGNGAERREKQYFLCRNLPGYVNYIAFKFCYITMKNVTITRKNIVATHEILEQIFTLPKRNKG